MGKRLNFWPLAGFLTVSVLGTLAHFAYEWSGKQLLAGAFCNLLFAGVLWLCGVRGAAVAMQLGTGLLSLLPFQQLDGGAFLRLWLPEQGEWVLRGVCVLIAVGGLCWGGVAGITNITYYCFLGSLLLTELLTK